jgi:ribose transport system substrate-binding protein
MKGRTWPVRLLALLAGLALATAVAACGSSNDDESGDAKADAGDSALSEQVAASQKEITQWPGPNTPVKPAAGKKITVLECGAVGITCVRIANGVKAAGAVLGWDVTVVDGRNQPAVWNSAVRDAVARKTDGIVLAAVPPAAVSAAITQANKAKIPVAYLLGENGANADLVLDTDRGNDGRMLARYVAQASGGKAKAWVLNDHEFPELDTQQQAFTEELAKVCSGCKVVGSSEFTLALAPQRLPGLVASALQQHPEVEWMIAPFDATVPFVVQGVRQAGKAAKVKVTGEGADPPGVQAIQQGQMAAAVGVPAEWMAWQAVDGLARTFNGEEVEKARVPSKLITKDNLPGANGWQGDFDYATKYKELWGK